MSNLKTVELVLNGVIPSKKNSRINTKDGQSFPNKKFVQWQEDSIVEIRRQTRQRFIQPVSLEVIIYFGTIGKADIDNKVTSLLDMFSEMVLIPDDKWQHVPIMKVQAEYRPGKPGAFIRIEELPDGYLGEEYAAAVAKNNAKKRK